MVEPVCKISREEIINEISQGCFVRKTNNGGNEIYIIDAISQPQTMKEIGRLREITFRNAGGGTGNSSDIDSHDLDKNGYKQLIVWNPVEEEIVGGYRFIVIDVSIKQSFSLTNYFDMGDDFKLNNLPYVIELGRSFIQPEYQLKAGSRKGIFALDNLWDGLGAIIVENPNMKYFIGKVTMYNNIDKHMIDSLYTLLLKYFPAGVNELTPKKGLEYNFNKDLYINDFDGLSYDEAVKLVTKKARSNGENYPPLFFAYANLSSSMKVFGTVVNPDFGDVLETAIMVTVEDIKKDKYDRYVSSYLMLKMNNDETK